MRPERNSSDISQIKKDKLFSCQCFCAERSVLNLKLSKRLTFFTLISTDVFWLSCRKEIKGSPPVLGRFSVRLYFEKSFNIKFFHRGMIYSIENDRCPLCIKYMCISFFLSFGFLCYIAKNLFYSVLSLAKLLE